MGDGLRIHLFGEPHLEYRGSSQAFSAPPKTLPMFAYLLLHRHAPVPRETLAAALWPDSDRAEALANVRRHLHYLTKALPSAEVPWVFTTLRTACWNVQSPYWLDVETFELESQERRYRAHAARLYAGDLYERCADEWIFYDRERLRSLQMSNLALLIDEHRERKAYLQALQYAQLMLALDPWREDAVRSVMDIRGLLGDASGAVSEYERFAQRLNAELGVAPSDETAQTYARLRRSAASVSTAGEVSSDAPLLYGRQNELAVVAEEWHRARQGRARILLVGGEAGIGKSALLENLAALARTEDATVLRGVSSADAPYDAFASALRDIEESPLQDAAQTAGSFEDRLAFFERIAAIVERTATRPTLLVLEDLHLAGSATLDLLRFLVTRLQKLPILFAASYREYEIDRMHPLRAFRRQLSRSGQLAHIAVTPIDRQSAHTLLRSRASRALDEDTMDRIYRAADGNPLFMLEALHLFAQGAGEAIPSSVATMVRARLASLDARTRTVVETAAVAGRHCTLELVAKVTGLREGEALWAVDELVERHILREAMPDEAAEFAFVHDLVLQAVYGQLAPDSRRKRHARVAMALQHLHAEHESEHAGALARHFELGGMHAEAAELYAIAAEHALRVYALDEAHYAAEKAGALAGDATVRARALLCMDSVTRARAAAAERADTLRAIEELAPQLPAEMQTEIAFRRTELLIATSAPQAQASLDDLRERTQTGDVHAARYLLLSGEYLQERGDHARAAGELRLAYVRFKEAGDLQRAFESYSAWLNATISSGNLRPEMIAELEQPQEQTDPRTAAMLAYARGRVHFNYDPAAAYAAGEDMLHAARLAEDRWLEALAYRTMGSSAAHLNQFTLAHNHLARCVELTHAAGRPYHMAYALYHQLQLYNRVAWIEPAYEVAREALRAARACGSMDLQVRMETNLADTDVAAGDLESAIARLGPALERAERYGLGGVRPAIGYLLGSLQVALESPARGIETLLEARALSKRFGISEWNYPIVLGLAYLCAGDRASALACASELREKKAEIAAQFFLPQVYLWATAHLFHFLDLREDAAALAHAAHERYTEMLATLHEGPMRDAFLAYRFNRAIVNLAQHDVWAREPLYSWFRPQSGPALPPLHP